MKYEDLNGLSICIIRSCGWATAVVFATNAVRGNWRGIYGC